MYKFDKLELEQFATFEDNYNPEIKEVQFNTEAQFSFDKEHSMLGSRITVNMMTHDGNLLAKAVLVSYFHILPDSLDGIKKDGKIIFTPNLLVQFSSLCYGSIRGVLFAKTIGTPLSNYILPPVFFDSLINKSFVINE